MKNIVISNSNLRKFEKAEVIEAAALYDDNWSLIAHVDGERIEDTQFLAGTENFEEFVRMVKEEYPTLSEKTFEEF